MCCVPKVLTRLDFLSYLSSSWKVLHQTGPESDVIIEILLGIENVSVM